MKTKHLGQVCFLELSLLIKAQLATAFTQDHTNREPALPCALGKSLLATDLKFFPIFHYGKLDKANVCDRVDVGCYLELENTRIACLNYNTVWI